MDDRARAGEREHAGAVAIPSQFLLSLREGGGVQRGERAALAGMPAGVATGRPLLEFSSRDGSLWVNGAPLILKGINWYGFETE